MKIVKINSLFLYVPVVPILWDGLEVRATYVVERERKGKSIDPSLGKLFFPVFETYKEAREQYPGAEIMAIPLREHMV